MLIIAFVGYLRIHQARLYNQIDGTHSLAGVFGFDLYRLAQHFADQSYKRCGDFALLGQVQQIASTKTDFEAGGKGKFLTLFPLFSPFG